MSSLYERPDLFEVIYPDWHAAASCHPDNGFPAELWWPERHGDKSVTRESIAEPGIAICKSCDVRLVCLREAIERGETDGVWGARDFGAGGRRERDGEQGAA